MSQPRYDNSEGAQPARRPTRTPRHILLPGHMETVREATPMRAVGRHADVHYCPTCGAKRKDCRCP